MGKGGLTVVAILGFIIGGAGLGVGAYSYFIFSDQITRLQNDIDNLEEDLDEKSGVQRTWYAEHLTGWSPSAINTMEAVPDLVISFQLSENEAILFSFSGEARTYKWSGFNYIAFYLEIDGTVLNTLYSYVGSDNQQATQVFGAVSIQYSDNTLAVGTHTVRVLGLSTYSGNTFEGGNLVVQTYIP